MAEYYRSLYLMEELSKKDIDDLLNLKIITAIEFDQILYTK